MQVYDGTFSYVGEDKRTDIVSYLNEGRINCDASGMLLLSLTPGDEKACVFCTDDKLVSSTGSIVTLPKHIMMLLSMTELSATIPASDFKLPPSLAHLNKHYFIMGIIRDVQDNVIGAMVIVQPRNKLSNQHRSYANITRQRIELLFQYQLIHHPYTNKLAESVQLLNEIGSISHTGGWELDLLAKKITWTNEMYHFFGISVGRTISIERALANLPQKSRSYFKNVIKQTLKTAKPFSVEVEYINADGIRRWMKVTGNPQCHLPVNGKNKVHRIFGSAQDITQVHRLSDTQHNYTEYLFGILNNVADPIITLDEHGTIVTTNDSVNTAFGYDAGELIGQDILLLVPNDDRDKTGAYISEYLKTGVLRGAGAADGANYFRFQHKKGIVFPADISLSTFTLDAQKRVVAVFHDMTEVEQKLDLVSHLAYYDGVTQLPNMQLFKQTIHSRLRNAQITYSDVYCVKINVLNITQYNQAFGRATGDYILRIIAGRLNRCFLPPFRVFKGDAFVFYLLYDDVIPDGQSKVNDTLASVETKLKDEVFDDITLHKSSHQMEARVSTCRLNGTTATVEKIIYMLADSIGYKPLAHLHNGNNENSGPNEHHGVNFRVASSAHYERYQCLKQSLPGSVKNNELFIELQPQYAGDGNIICAEALLRWQHPKLGLVSPGEFIPIAEETDAIVELGAWVINESCKLLCNCKNSGLDTRLSINVSAKHIARADFSDTLLALVKKWQVPPGSLTLELTEATLIGSFALVRQRIRFLASHGFAFSIDDFGTGTSNLNYLKDLPIKELKVDRQFIDELTVSGSSSILVNSICDMARAFDLRTVAEGIENDHQFNYAKKCGCNAFQGYYLDKPMHVKAWVEKLISEQINHGLY